MIDMDDPGIKTMIMKLRQNGGFVLNDGQKFLTDYLHRQFIKNGKVKLITYKGKRIR